MNIELEHINAVNRKTKLISYHSTVIFLCFHQSLDEKVGTGCSELSTKQLDQLEFCPSEPTMVAAKVDPRLGITLPTLKLEIQITSCH